MNQMAHDFLAPSSGVQHAVAMETRYDVKAFDRFGKLLWEEVAYNRVVTVGLNKLLDATFKTGGTPAWFVGIVGPEITDGSISTGSALLSSVTAPWQTVDASQPIIVRGAGASGADLVTTILTSSAAGTISLSTTALTTVAAAAVIWGARSTDTSTAHTPWTESTYYTGSRPAFTPGSIASGSVDNSGSPASFSINNNNTLIGGCFLATSSSLLSSTDTLYGMAPFATVGFRQLNNGDTLSITATLTAASA